jgi:hypothetical protein
MPLRCSRIIDEQGPTAIRHESRELDLRCEQELRAGEELNQYQYSSF